MSGPQYPLPNYPPPPSWSPPPARRTFPWLAVLGSAALALILVVGVTAVLVWDRGDSSGDRSSKSEALRERLLAETRRELPTTAKVDNAVPGYDYSAAVTDVGVDADLAIAATYDADVSDPWRGAEGKIEVYADAQLTKPVPISILPDAASPTSDPHLVIDAMRLRRTHIVRKDGQAKGTMADLGTYWNINPNVYVVQYLTPDGAERDRPLVTEVNFQSETPSPAQVSSGMTPDGDALLEWSPVEGASEYLVVLQQRRSSGSVTVQVIGRTSEPTWSSVETERCLQSTCTQNTSMTLTTINASTMTSLPGLVAESIDARLGVVAVVDREASVMAPIDFTGLETLPVRSDRKWDAGADVADRGLAALPSRFLFVSIDGSTRATGAFIDRKEVGRSGSTWEVPLRGRGTRLVDTVRIPAAAVKDIDAAVKTFNARAQRDYPHSGLLDTRILIDVSNPEKPSPELPAPDYPIFGSNDLTIFIASQLVAGSTAIDVSDFDDEPGLPSIKDALDEAVYQNPYAFAYFDQFAIAGSVIHVEPAYSKAEKQTRQKRLADAAEALVARVIKPGMSASDKVGAINRHFVDNADYDDKALASATTGYRSDIPDRYRYAWEPDGILVDGSGVCMSYAYAFHVVAEEAGVESVVVTGDLADGGGHAWNKVKIGNRWRAVDVTWNDPGGRWTARSGETYLMIDDAQFTGNALRSEDERWMADALVGHYATR
ncbi:hypothetical protein BJ980_002364 [Nocardioides daedukensis]|uniref:Transglutaminase-like domain-containing protein n=1 Tax=Nocardioides daedukensis TaxID=634462 RepID=A0A7Y9UR94_9ACTN|nr:transglutaminase domain-containing protein [Nocardioides daedukensis]NYG59441.1 hypothetical protein [Nocardioides daedukensis]